MIRTLAGGFTPSVPEEVLGLIADGALFVVNHSAGKDSQAMALVIRSLVPADQILVVHADLGRVEWPGNVEHIRSTIDDLPLLVCRNERKDFLQLTEARGRFPLAQQRQCTSDLKRDPIEREVRRYLKENPRFGGKVVTCLGIRAQESAGRAKAKVFQNYSRGSIAGRKWFLWNPIHDMSLDEVWATIAGAGQKRHFAYDLGMSRLSCCFCILSSDKDLTIAAKARPELYREYVQTERRLGCTLTMPSKGKKRTLEDITGVLIEDEGSGSVELAA